MLARRSVNRLSPWKAAYVAGLIDGEGTVTLTRLHRNENRRLVVCVSNNEVAILHFLLTAIGAGKITGKRTYHDRHRASFTYQISSRQALALLHQTIPYMISYKALRARLALAEYVKVTPRNGRYTKQLLEMRADFAARFFSIRP
jgi:hypothetical protein